MKLFCKNLRIYIYFCGECLYLLFSNDKTAECPFQIDEESAIDDVEVADEEHPVQYFNLQGQRVDRLVYGVYIRVE